MSVCVSSMCRGSGAMGQQARKQGADRTKAQTLVPARPPPPKASKASQSTAICWGPRVQNLSLCGILHIQIGSIPSLTNTLNLFWTEEDSNPMKDRIFVCSRGEKDYKITDILKPTFNSSVSIWSRNLVKEQLHQEISSSCLETQYNIVNRFKPLLLQKLLLLNSIFSALCNDKSWN